MRVQVLVSVGPGPGHSGSDGVNGEAPPPGGMVPGWLTRCAAAEAVAVSAPARCRGDRVGLRNGGVHVLRPAVGRGRPEEPPAADDAAGRRPGKSARSPSASGGVSVWAGEARGGVAARLRGCPRRRQVPGCGAVSGLGGEAASQECEPAPGQLRSAAARVPKRPGPAPRRPGWLRLQERGRARREEPRGRPGPGPTLPCPFWGRGDALQVYSRVPGAVDAGEGLWNTSRVGPPPLPKELCSDQSVLAASARDEF